jgi:hypothetical protein
MNITAHLRGLILALPLAGAAAAVALSGLMLTKSVVDASRDGQSMRQDEAGIPVAVPIAPPAASRITTHGEEFLRRPLFDRTRRPVSPAPPPTPVVAVAPRPPAPPVATPKPPLPIVLGVVVSGTRRVAILRTGNEPQLRYVEAGATVGGWHVAVISPDTVRFSLDGDIQEQKLFPKPPPGLHAARPAGPPTASPGQTIVGQK